MSIALPKHGAGQGKSRSRPLILLLVLSALTIFVIDQAGDSAPTHPIRSVLRDASSSVSNSLSDLWPFNDSASVRYLKQQNADLRNQLDQAQGQVAQQDDLRRQNETLSSLMDLQTFNDVPKIVAPVTAIGASNFDSTIELGKGTDAGIQSGMPVVTAKGLVGRVIQTSNKSATVLLVVDTTSNVGVRFGTGEIGVAVGAGMNKSMRVDLIDITSPLKQGDVAVTSGQDHSLYPPGIPVGTVDTVAAAAQNLRMDVRLKPAVDVNQLSDVAVLQWKP